MWAAPFSDSLHKRTRKKEALLWCPCLTLAGKFTCPLAPALKPTSSGSQCRLKASNSPGILQSFSAKVTSHLTLWNEQLLHSQPPQCQKDTVGLPKLYCVRHVNTSPFTQPFTHIHMYPHTHTHTCSFREPWQIQIVVPEVVLEKQNCEAALL